MVAGNIDTIGGKLKSYDFSGYGENMTSYTELFLGISHQINDKWTVGIRGKLLFGIANTTTNSSEVNMTSISVDGVENSAYKMRSLLTINSSVPNLRVVKKSDGKIDSLIFDDVKASNAKTTFINPKNMGFGLDFGIIFKPIERLSLSATFIHLNKMPLMILGELTFC